ncbi:TetR/AcrR family transcriptional regulator [Kribbella jejuensis]|uniref:TetR/AcrR family transcriptional regulator n=1 Tax=Kribbella jejuensis TaxID=236068 RepID=UPI00192DAAE5|nr:TetR/AcrR family transcriptional regulator [Kribbella jejuensis]
MNEPTPRSSRAQQRIETQDRILAAARQLFADTGYDRTTIRAIAAAAQVDAGLVMHYFGSKEKLFALSTRTDTPLVSGETPEEVAEQLLGILRQSLIEEPIGSLAALRSMLTHPDAAAEVGNAHAERVKVSKAIPGVDGNLRAAVLSAILIGVVLGRHLVKFEELADAEPDEIVELLRPVVFSLTKAAE